MVEVQAPYLSSLAIFSAPMVGSSTLLELRAAIAEGALRRAIPAYRVTNCAQRDISCRRFSKKSVRR
jgi:hypothetical protein